MPLAALPLLVAARRRCRAADRAAVACRPRHAQGCPDIEVVFARGTDEPPGLGRVGTGVRRLAARPGRWPLGRHVRRQLPGELRLPRRRRRRQRRQRPHPVHDGQLPARPDWCSAATRRAPRSSTSSPRCRFPAVGFTAPLPPEHAGLRRRDRGVRQPDDQGRVCRITVSPVWGPRSIDLCNGADPVCSARQRHRRPQQLRHRRVHRPGGGVRRRTAVTAAMRYVSCDF